MMTKTRSRPVAIPLGWLCLVAACRGSGFPETTQVTDSAGVTIAASGPSDRPAPWDIAEVRRLGGADTGVLAFFVRPSQVAADLAGRLYVLHEDLGRIDVFDTVGTLLRRFGRRGSGPGELRIPGRLSVREDGTVWVIDYAKAALVVFDSTGAALPQVPFTATGNPFGGIVVMGDAVLIDQRDVEDGVPVRTLRLISPGDTIELARHVGGAPMTTAAQFRCPNGGRYTMRGLPRLFDPWLTWQASEGQVVTTNQTPYQIRWFREGRLAAILRREVPSVAATVEHVARLYPAGRAMGNRLCVVSPDVLAEQQGIAETLPSISALALAPDGSLWVGRFTFPDEPSRIDVFSTDGVYRGTLTGVPPPLGFLPNGQFVGTLPHPESGGEILGVFRLTPAPW